MAEQRARRNSRWRHELSILVDSEAREQLTQCSTLRLLQRWVRQHAHRRGRDRLRCAPLEEKLWYHLGDRAGA